MRFDIISVLLNISMTTPHLANHMHLILEWATCLLLSFAFACKIVSNRARLRQATPPRPPDFDSWEELAALKIRERGLQEHAKTQDALLREVNHRVKNNFSSIIGLLQMKREYALTLQEARHLHDMETRLTGMAATHCLLTLNAWQPIRMDTLCRTALRTALDPDMSPCIMTVKDTPDSPLINHSQAHHLTLIIHELVANTLKHAIPSVRPLATSITVSPEGPNATLLYTDNGPGYPDTIIRNGYHADRTGLRIISTLVSSSLQGICRLYNHGGAVTSISFPLHAPQGKT